MKIKITVDRMGGLTLVTQDGDFEGGEATLNALLAALQAQGVSVQNASPVETHNHDVQLQRTGAFAGRVMVNAAVTESGPPHSH